MAVAAFSFLAGRLSASEFVTVDGSWWQELDGVTKLRVMQGMIPALVTGHKDGALDESTRITKEVDASSKLNSPQKKLVDAVAFRMENGTFASTAHPPNFTRTFGYYVAAVDDFYIRKSTSLLVPYVVECLSDVPDDYCAQFLGTGR
jgi:hypothetical protein